MSVLDHILKRAQSGQTNKPPPEVPVKPQSPERVGPTYQWICTYHVQHLAMRYALTYIPIYAFLMAFIYRAMASLFHVLSSPVVLRLAVGLSAAPAVPATPGS